MDALKNANRIETSRPYMPPREEIDVYLERIWSSRQLTNRGILHEEFEDALCRYLGVKHLCMFANGTLALMLGLKALNLKGEVITTPFTSAATIQAIKWNGLTPVFVDISRRDLNIQTAEIRSAITSQTSAVLPVHVFGNPCDVEGIAELARQHHLKVLYDAAACFGIRLKDTSLLNFGDLSMLSFHATKVFHSIEGGALVCHDRAMKEHIDALKIIRSDQGEDNDVSGFNAKMNEVQAAFGLACLKHIDEMIRLRKLATEYYREIIGDVEGIRVVIPSAETEHNYTYFSIIIDPVAFGCDRNMLADHLEKKGIISRKYFHPLACDYKEFKKYKTTSLPIAENISARVLCLPLFHDISREEIRFIVDAIRQLQSATKN